MPAPGSSLTPQHEWHKKNTLRPSSPPQIPKLVSSCDKRPAKNAVHFLSAVRSQSISFASPHAPRSQVGRANGKAEAIAKIARLAIATLL